MACAPRYILFVLLPLIFTACVTTRNCEIETLQPAKLSFTSQAKKIAICASPKILSNAIVANQDAHSVPADSVVLNILYSLQKFWKEAPGFEGSDFIVFLTTNDTSDGTSGFDLIVRLDQLRIKNSYYGEQFGSYFADRHYYTEWEAYLQVYYIAEWSIRDGSGKLLDDYTDRDLIVWPSGIKLGKSEAVLNLPGIKDAWWDLGITLAKNYAARTTPQWEKGVRSFYMINKFPELSSQANTAMQNNGYARAFGIWENMMMSCRKRGQRKLKSKIAYNMAIASELQNQLDEAIKWAEQSTKYSKNKFNTSYIEMLKTRQKQSEKLDQQIYR